MHHRRTNGGERPRKVQNTLYIEVAEAQRTTEDVKKKIGTAEHEVTESAIGGGIGGADGHLVKPKPKGILRSGWSAGDGRAPKRCLGAGKRYSECRRVS
jgi:hypothetical protein